MTDPHAKKDSSPTGAATPPCPRCGHALIAAYDDGEAFWECDGCGGDFDRLPNLPPVRNEASPMSAAPVTRFVSRYFVGQEPNGDPLVDLVLWEQVGESEPVAVMVRGQVTAEEWIAATAELGTQPQ